MERIAQVFKALSEEIRLRVLMLLTEGELCVCDLMAIFEVPQSKISRHLAYLKNSGLIGSRRVGVWMHYFLKEDLDEISQAQIDLLKEKIARQDSFRKDVDRMIEVKDQKLCESQKPQTARSKREPRTGGTA